MSNDPAIRPAPPGTQQIGRDLRALFTQDQALAVALNDALRRHRDAIDQLTTGLSAEALRTIYGPTGPDLGLSGRKPPVLLADSPVRALEDVARDARTALHDYMRISDDRRVLAADVGELTARLIEALTTAGLSEEQARHANVDHLADGQLHTDTRGADR